MSTPPGQQPILDDDVLMRRVRRQELTTDQEGGPARPSSDAFKQDGAEGETSVYLFSETTPERISYNYPDIFVALVDVGLLRQLGLNVERSAMEGEPGHCVITGRETRSVLREHSPVRVIGHKVLAQWAKNS